LSPAIRSRMAGVEPPLPSIRRAAFPDFSGTHRLGIAVCCQFGVALNLGFSLGAGR
jgi:hypothetical protein